MSDPTPASDTKNWVALEGATNVRDIGGWEVGSAAGSWGSGERLRTGALYRGDRLNNLTENDLDELASRGIRTVVDFRAPSEVERDPSRLWAGVSNFVPLPIAERDVEPVAMLDRILTKQITSASEAEMADIYLALLEDNAAQFARFVTIAADVDNWPMLYHCTAGKDRTGLATAMLMELCGVARSDVLDEYEITNEQRSKKRMAELAGVFESEGIDIEAVRPLLTAPRAVLAGTLERLDGMYSGEAEIGELGEAEMSEGKVDGGGVFGYLATQAGLDAGELAAVVESLRANLLI